MQRNAIKKYVLIGLCCLIVNILIFIFWWVVTDPSNYIWKSISADRGELIVSACNRLFFIRYYISFVVLNAIFFSFVLFDTKRYLSICIVAFSLLFYVVCYYCFKPLIGKNYFVIFLNQNANKAFYLEPVQDAGNSIGPFLFEHLNTAPSFTREQAARGLGILSFTSAIPAINKLLTDTTETVNMRAECYFALKKMNVKESKLLLEKFSEQQETVMDSSLVQKITYLELRDPY